MQKLLSFVVCVPRQFSDFVLGGDPKGLKLLLRKYSSIRAFTFSQEVVLAFFQLGLLIQEKTKEYALYEMAKLARKKESIEVMALMLISQDFLEKKWSSLCGSEESFIDQRLVNVKNLTAFDSSSSSNKDFGLTMKPDFIFSCGDAGFLAVEVKPPGVRSSQVLTNQSKLGFELKRMLDQQILQGPTEAKSFGLLVEGLKCTFIYVVVEACGVYLIVEELSFSLPSGAADFSMVLGVTQHFVSLR
ncbi:hypothetical protein A0J61_10540, partial [Choanephora cucurbitarum]